MPAMLRRENGRKSQANGLDSVKGKGARVVEEARLESE